MTSQCFTKSNADLPIASHMSKVPMKNPLVSCLVLQLEAKNQELRKSKTDLLSQETERSTFRAELERLKDVTAAVSSVVEQRTVMYKGYKEQLYLSTILLNDFILFLVSFQNRVNEEKLVEATSKLSELQQQCESVKLEKDSWKVRRSFWYGVPQIS